MKTLFLSGYGINLSVDGGRLVVRNGRDLDREPKEVVLRPKSDEYDGVVVYGHTGNITLDAMKWLAKHGVQLIVLNWDGKLLYTLDPPEIKASKYRMAQYNTYASPKRIGIAKALIAAKIASTTKVVDWLGARYGSKIENLVQLKGDIQDYQKMLMDAKSVPEVMGIEGMVARRNFDAISGVLDDRLEFSGRSYGKRHRPAGAVDPVNALFNYGYALLEAQCRRAAYASGLDPGVGFLHESMVGKASLVYDLQEPFRWLVDVTLIEALERHQFDRRDFLLTENYNVRIRPEGVRRLIGLVDARLTSKAMYGRKLWEWGNVVVAKADELARYLTHERKTLDFTTPGPELRADDAEVMRQRILGMSYSEWKKAGFSKGTLHELKAKARKPEPFKIHDKVMERLEGQA